MAMQNCALIKAIVPVPKIRIALPLFACAALATRQAFAPGSTSAPRVSSISSGSSSKNRGSIDISSARAPSKPFRIPISYRSWQVCWRPSLQREHLPQPIITSPTTRFPIQLESTPSPTRTTVPVNSCPIRIGNFAWPS